MSLYKGFICTPLYFLEIWCRNSQVIGYGRLYSIHELCMVRCRSKMEQPKRNLFRRDRSTTCSKFIIYPMFLNSQYNGGPGVGLYNHLKTILILNMIFIPLFIPIIYAYLPTYPPPPPLCPSKVGGFKHLH